MYVLRSECPHCAEHAEITIPTDTGATRLVRAHHLTAEIAAKFSGHEDSCSECGGSIKVDVSEKGNGYYTARFSKLNG